MPNPVLDKYVFGQQILSMGQIAKMVGVASRTVQKWFDSGKLPGIRLPESRDRRVYRDDLAKFCVAHGMRIPKDLLPKRAVACLMSESEARSLGIDPLARDGDVALISLIETAIAVHEMDAFAVVVGTTQFTTPERLAFAKELAVIGRRVTGFGRIAFLLGEDSPADAIVLHDYPEIAVVAWADAPRYVEKLKLASRIVNNERPTL